MPPPPPSASATLAWLTSLHGRFQAAWDRDGAATDLDRFLPASGPERRSALAGLAPTDLERRLRAGVSVRTEDYCDRYPELASDSTLLLALAAHECRTRLRLGLDGGLADLVRRFPEFEKQLAAEFAAPASAPSGTDTQSTVNPTGSETEAPAGLAPLRYRPLQFHAQGNLGEVLYAQDDELHRQVALKRIQERFAQDPDSLRRFLREAEVTGRLEHPGVVPVYGLGQDEQGRPCYAMRFVQGETLKDAIDRFHAVGPTHRDGGARRLELRRLLSSFGTVCKTIAYAHSRGILHRDLKPANVMLGKYGETLVVDWGLAKAFARGEEARAQGEESLAPEMGSGGQATQAGTLAGTPAFMSPEQASGQWGLVGPASDIFGLGATLYNLLTGSVPYQGENLLLIVAQASLGEVVPPRERMPDVPRPLEAVCLKAMAKERGQRYRTALELAADVEAFLADEPVVAYPESVGERLGRVGRRYRGWVVAAGVGVVALAAVGVALVLAESRRGERTARQTAEAAQEQEQAARQVAEEQRGRAERAQGETEEARKAEAVQRRVAEANGRLAEERLILSQVANGWALWDKGDGLAAAVWFAKALVADKGGPEHEALHRQRLGTVLRQCPKLTQVLPHEGRVAYAEFSPDGGRVVTASRDRTARIWNAATGLPVLPPLKHSIAVQQASFSPDGRRLVTAAGNEARVWDAVTGQPLTPPMKHGDPNGQVERASFSPDSRRVVTASRDGGRVWDAETGQQVTPLLKHDKYVRWASFSPDGRHVVTASWDETAQVWDAATGAPAAPPFKQQSILHQASFSPDGRRIVTAGQDYLARVWDAATGQPAAPPMRHADAVVRASFSPDGSRVVTACKDGYARVWDAGTGQPIGAAMRHDGDITVAVFSPDGRRIVTASHDYTARVWDAATGYAVTPPLKHDGRVWHAAFHPDGRRLVTASEDNTARLWDTATGQPVTPPLYSASRVNQASFTPDGTRVVISYSFGGTARVRDAATGQPLTPPLPHKGGIKYGSFSPDGRRVVTASTDRTARVWDAATGQPLAPPLQHGGEVRQALFSPDGLRVVTASEDGTARVWNAATGQPVTPPLKHRYWVVQASFSPDGKRVLTAGWDGMARVWDAATGKPLTPFMEPTRGLAMYAASFSPDGRRLVTASTDKSARVWDAATGQPVTPPLKHNDWVHGALFSPDSRRVVTASLDYTARVWDAATGQPLAPPLKHNGTVTSAAFSPDGSMVVTASNDGSARVWDAATGQPVTPSLRHRYWVIQASFSPDGRRLSTVDAFGTTQVWDISTAAWPAQDLFQLTQMLAGHRLDDQGGVIPLDLAAAHREWTVLRGRYPDFCSPSTAAIGAWDRQEAEACARENNWPAAIFHLDHAIQAEPDNKSDRRSRAGAHAALGHWREAAEDFRQGLDNAFVVSEQSQYGLVLAAGDPAGHQRFCENLLARFADHATPREGNDMAWLCIRFRHGPADPSRALRLAEKGVQAAPGSYSNLNTLGVALYRAGRDQEAIQRLSDGIKLHQSGGKSEDWMFLALAHHRLGHTQEARPWLTKAQQVIDAVPPGWPWDMRLELKLLRQEAEEELAKPPPGVKP